MMSENEIREMYQHTIYMFCKTERDSYLHQMEALGKILGMTAKEEEIIYNQMYVKVSDEKNMDFRTEIKEELL